jgi:hypothetical protein
MRADAFVSRILDDEGLTSGLNDPEARLLVEWLIDQVERIRGRTESETAAWQRIETLCRRARGIRRFVSLWCHVADHGAATQLVAAERYGWPLPPSNADDPCDVLQPILEWEASQAAA